MGDYKNGKIYAIKSPQTDKIYIGSTTQSLNRRWHNHRNDNYNPNREEKRCTSKKIMDHEDAYIELLEAFPCNTKQELNKREGELQLLHDCVNRCKMTGLISKRPNIMCECGVTLQKFCEVRDRHINSFKHRQYLEFMESSDDFKFL